MKLLRPTADPNAQLELPLAEPAPAAPAPQNLLAPQADPAAPSADVAAGAAQRPHAADR